MAFNWSKIDSGSMRGRLLRIPLRLLPPASIMKIRRGPARGLRWIAGSANHGCWLGTYELDKQAAIARFIRPGMTVYDVGAQAGFYTLTFSRLVGGNGRVIAFEPCPNEARHLLDHVRMNALANVTVIEAAVSDRAGLAGFSFDRPRTENALCETAGAQLQVPTVTLDHVCAGMPAPDLVKIDVEGAEAAVLAGGSQTLRRFRPALFVALHNAEQRRLCELRLREAGYAINYLDGRAVVGNITADEIYATMSGRSEILDAAPLDTAFK
ncbi:MAG: FkbM family methyltransferase [Candidatus Binataceae bacterium]